MWAMYWQSYPVRRLIEARQFRVEERPWPAGIVVCSEGFEATYGTRYGMQIASGVTPIFDRDWIERIPRVWTLRAWTQANFQRVV